MKTDREKLIDFYNWMGELDREKIMSMEEHPVDVYLESINKALDETKTVNNNEVVEKLCDCYVNRNETYEANNKTYCSYCDGLA